MHSDAKGSGQIAAKCRVDGNTSSYSVHFPRWVVDLARVSALDAGIFTFEMVDAIFALTIDPSLGFKGLVSGIFCIDNHGWLEAMIRGAARNALGAARESAFRNLPMRMALCPWLGRGSSGANYADIP